MHLLNPVHAVLMLTLDGRVYLRKSYDDKIELKKLEKDLYKKTKCLKRKTEILTSDGFFIVHRCVASLHIYIVGDKNACMTLDRILFCLVEAVSTIVNRSAHSCIFDSSDQIIKACDDIFYKNIVLETDPDQVLEKVYKEVDATEQSIEQVLQSASEYLKFSWFKG